MTSGGSPGHPSLGRAPFGRSLSARLLLLTVAFLLLGEVLIFVPSMARFRLVYLEERIAAAHLATIGPAQARERPSPAIEDALLSHAGVLSVIISRGEPVLMLGLEAPVDLTIRLGDERWPSLVLDAVATLYHGGQRVIRVVGPSPMELGTTVEVTLTELPLHAAMKEYAWRILVLSLVLSLIVGAMLFIALRGLIVLPLADITRRLAHFHRRPEDQSLVASPSRRSDEIGIVDRELDAMTTDLRQALAQKTRLAALGEAVSKLNHDLRNILGTALLVSDRLERSADPAVRAVAPKLIQTLERAIRLCQDTLDFARSRPARPRMAALVLRDLVDEVIGDLELPAGLVVENEVPDGLLIQGDLDQLHRLFSNLARNALEALAEGGRLSFSSRQERERVVVEVSDTGPGLPEAVQARLFEPFAASTSKNGSGLGLAISREIARAHGGELVLLATGAEGTTFLISLPAALSRAAA
jgi:signal transduction histidine kinase